MTGSERLVSKFLGRHISSVFLALFSLFLCFWFQIYFTGHVIPSVDLPSFISGVESLRIEILRGNFSFYDHTTFGGWVPFLLYGVIPGILVSLCSWMVPFASEPVRLATHLMLVFGVALFPWCFWYAARPFATAIVGEQFEKPSVRGVFALSVITFSFWFLNHDRQWFGIGAAAPMNIGLFGQLFAWLFMLLYFGALLRILQNGERRSFQVLALSLGLLIPTHALSAVYSLFIGGLTFLFFSQKRSILLWGHLLGIGIAAFWLFPFMSFVGAVSPLDIPRPSGDFLEIFFRYPAWGLLQTLVTWLHTGEMRSLNPINILNILLVGLLFAHSAIRRGGLHHTFFLFILCSLVFFSSGFIATSLQVGFHYYRFLAYVFLFTTVLLSTVPLVFLQEEWGALRGAAVGILLIICFASTVLLPHYEREKISRYAGRDYLTVENRLIEYFASLPQKGRVYIEYLTDYKHFPPLSAHYLASRLPKDTGFEAIPNSHLQEAPAYRMMAATMTLLKANTYHVPLLYTDTARLSDETLLQQLRDFGVTHVVAGLKPLKEKLESLGLPKKEIGKYAIFTLREGALQPTVRVISRLPICYLDKNGTLPFRLLQYYFYSEDFLYNSFELLDCNHLQEIPSPILYTLINGGVEEESRHVLWMNYAPQYTLDHYSPHYPYNRELDHYRSIERYVEGEFFLLGKLKKLAKNPSSPNEEVKNFRWSADGQKIVLSSLQSDSLYKLNYTYFSLWRSNGAVLLRGMGERMYLIPRTEEVTLEFSRWHSKSSWLGLFMTLLSFLVIFFLPSRRFAG